MNTFISVFALLASGSAFAGSHVSIVTLPYDHTPITSLRVENVTYGKVIVDTQTDPNCDADQVCPVYKYATKVRVDLSYLSPAAFDRVEDTGYDYGRGKLNLSVDFDPSQFTAEELARLSDRRTAKAFFSASARQEQTTVSVIDWERSETCLEEGTGEGSLDHVKAGCTPRKVYKNINVDATFLKVKSNN